MISHVHSLKSPILKATTTIIQVSHHHEPLAVAFIVDLIPHRSLPLCVNDS
jgi:hypothetical protein